MCLAVEAVVAEEEGSAEEDDAGHKPADEEDKCHHQLVLAPISSSLDQVEVGRRWVSLSLH